MRWACMIAALLFTGCASMPDMKDGGLPLAGSGWRMTGGADLEKKAWFLLFWRPWGKAESDAAIAADKIVLP
jgi:hypothetical protein